MASEPQTLPDNLQIVCNEPRRLIKEKKCWVGDQFHAYIHSLSLTTGYTSLLLQKKDNK